MTAAAESRREIRDGHARRAQLQDEHAHAVADHVDDVGGEGNVHGHIGPADAPAQGRARVVNGEKGEGERRDPEVGLAGRHHVRFDPAEQETQKLRAEQEDQRRHNGGNDRGDHQELTGGAGGRPVVFAADVLADDDRAAGGERREQEDQHGVERRDQRHAGDVRLAGKADDEGVRDAHEHQQELLHEQREDQVFQAFVRKHITPRISP